MLLHLLDFGARRFAYVADKNLIWAASRLLFDVAPGEPFELGGLLHGLRVNYHLLINSSDDLFSRFARFKARFGCFINFHTVVSNHIIGFLIRTLDIFIFDRVTGSSATFGFTKICRLHRLRVVDGVRGQIRA